jgi:tRNA modification GTPase
LSITSTAYNSDTIVALSTPPGVGAIGVIRMSGPDALGVTNKIFRKGKNLPTKVELFESHTLHFGTLNYEDGRVLDEVVIGLYKNPKSYTKEDLVEISCHGSPYILSETIKLCLRNGARLALPGEFTLRAFLNGRMDLTQAEAVADLIASENEGSQALAMAQLRGGVKREISRMREDLIHFASLIELELDFGEEDVEFANRKDLMLLVEQLRLTLGPLLASFSVGNAIRNGVPTVLAGRPNAGKSTLLNALLGENRAIVSEIAGTTRDTIEDILNIDGIQFRLVDTAGIREATDTIERIGVQRALYEVERASILIYVMDAVATSPSDALQDVLKLQREGLKTIILRNKTDLLVGQGSIEKNGFLGDFHIENGGLPKGWHILSLSANSGEVGPLKSLLVSMVTSGQSITDKTMLTNARHYEALSLADQSLADTLEGLKSGITGDFIAMDIRRALHHLGEVSGSISSDDLLANIFGKFCIGK